MAVWHYRCWFAQDTAQLHITTAEGYSADSQFLCCLLHRRLSFTKRLHMPVLVAMQSIVEDGTPEEQQQLADLHLEMLQLVSVVHTNPLRDAPHELLASGWSAPYTFMQLVAASWATNTMVAETWQQVQGAKPVGNWSCLKLVSQAVLCMYCSHTGDTPWPLTKHNMHCGISSIWLSIAA
jgi:hypothetical protein